MLIRTIILVLVLTTLCAMATATNVYSEFDVNTIDGETATMMHYTYLKEPTLDNHYGGNTSPKAKGLKTGAFNYLVKGEFNFNDYLHYYDGQPDGPVPRGLFANYNTSVTHEMYVNFDGEKGISEFFGKGFFPNNRAISAFKKIRYDDFGDYVPGETYMAPSFTVDAYVDMGNQEVTGNPNGDYDFYWTADAEDAVVEVWDSTGWTNATGARMVDWEQTALVKGTINMTNSLYASGLYIPAAGGPVDWLPCCFDPLKYVELSIDYGDQWPNVNQQVLFNCSCPDEISTTEVPEGVTQSYLAALYGTPGYGTSYYLPGKGAGQSTYYYLPGAKYPNMYYPA